MTPLGVPPHQAYNIGLLIQDYVLDMESLPRWGVAEVDCGTHPLVSLCAACQAGF